MAGVKRSYDADGMDFGAQDGPQGMQLAMFGAPSAKRHKRSRFNLDEDRRQGVPGYRFVLPNNMSVQDQWLFVAQLRVDEITRVIDTNRHAYMDDDPEWRSPSPEPEMSPEGYQTNQRMTRRKLKLEKERADLIEKITARLPEYGRLIPGAYLAASPREVCKVRVPAKENPDVNYMGLIIGPRGSSLKKLEGDTGAKVSIRGKGSEKEGSRRYGPPPPGHDEEMHCLISADTLEGMEKCREQLVYLLEHPEQEEGRKQEQLRLLAVLNGTLREQEACRVCGALDHETFACPDRDGGPSRAAVRCFHCQSTGHLSSDCPNRNNQLAVGGAGGGGILPSAAAAAAINPALDSEYAAFMATITGEAPAAPAPPPADQDAAYAEFLSALKN